MFCAQSVVGNGVHSAFLRGLIGVFGQARVFLAGSADGLHPTVIGIEFSQVYNLPEIQGCDAVFWESPFPAFCRTRKRTQTTQTATSRFRSLRSRTAAAAALWSPFLNQRIIWKNL